MSKIKLGLLGFNCRQGLGELNRQIATYCRPARWLVVPHRSRPTLPFLDGIDMRLYRGLASLVEFVRAVDVVLFCETPLLPQVLPLCRRFGRRVVCVPMQEWLPPDKSWVRQVDSFVCPTRHCYDELQPLGLPCDCFQWPVDVSRFAFRERATCQRFLYLEGHGGTGGRKGAAVVRSALTRWPDMPLIVRTQRRSDWPAGVDVRSEVPSNKSLYDEGDVLILPHSVDGIALEPHEAMASGMPVISTAGRPWDEYPALALIETSETTKTIGRRVTWYLPSPDSLVECCRAWLGRDISQQSRDGRAWAESRRWENRADEFLLLVTG